MTCDFCCCCCWYGDTFQCCAVSCSLSYDKFDCIWCNLHGSCEAIGIQLTCVVSAVRVFSHISCLVMNLCCCLLMLLQLLQAYNTNSLHILLHILYKLCYIANASQPSIFKLKYYSKLYDHFKQNRTCEWYTLNSLPKWLVRSFNMTASLIFFFVVWNKWEISVRVAEHQLGTRECSLSTYIFAHIGRINSSISKLELIEMGFNLLGAWERQQTGKTS